MKKLLLLLLILHSSLFIIHCYAQTQHELDSLLNVLKSSKEDTNKVHLLYDLSVNRNLAGNYAKAMKYGDESLTLAEKIDFKEGIGDAFFQIGNVSCYMTDYPKGLENFLKALTIFEQTGNKNSIAKVSTEVGNTYIILRYYPKALDYLQKALKTDEILKNKPGLADVYSYLGRVYHDQLNYSEALKNYVISLNYCREIGDMREVAICLDEIGSIYEAQGNHTEALKNYQEALKMREPLGVKWGISGSYTSISNVYFHQANYSEALKYATKGLSIAMEIGQKQCIMSTYENLAAIDAAMNNFRGAYEHQKLFKKYNDSLFNMEKDKKITQLSMNYEFDKKDAANKVEQDKKDARQRIVRNSIGTGFAGALIFLVVVYRQRNKISKARKRSDELLLNILPAEVAEELKEKGSAEAQQIDEVTVLFTDFKGFTQLSEKLTPKQLVGEINECFSAFDIIMEKYGIEKIKTIGDSYMAAGGLPTPNKTHATDVVKAALDIHQYMKELRAKKEAEGKLFFEIRTGIHSGPVVAGIVGIKKFAYDIWGDTVNTASRMESSGEPGKVNISGTTYEIVKNYFKCTYRGKVQAKGKGEVDMYFVEG